jgi:hypothetical protein
MERWAPELPDSFRDMEPLFWRLSAPAMRTFIVRRCMKFTFHGFSEGRPASPLTFWELGRLCFQSWCIFSNRDSGGSPVETSTEAHSLTPEDQLFILMQAALYLTATRGLASTEAKICYERAESLCHSLNRPLLLFSTLVSQWRYSFVTEKLTATLKIAERSTLEACHPQSNSLPSSVASASSLAK